MPMRSVKRAVKIMKIALFAIETVVVLAVSMVVLIYGADALPDLRPCTSTPWVVPRLTGTAVLARRAYGVYGRHFAREGRSPVCPHTGSCAPLSVEFRTPLTLMAFRDRRRSTGGTRSQRFALTADSLRRIFLTQF
jgi:hypothetical protein